MRTDAELRQLGAYDEIIEAAMEQEALQKAADEAGAGCGRKIGLFNCCTCVCIDCLEAMKAIPDGAVDAVITDPPYGIGYKSHHENSIEYELIHGDDKPFDPSPILGRWNDVILWGGNNFADFLPVGGWIVWDKRCCIEADRIMGSSFELAWCSRLTVFKMIRVLHGGAKNADAPNGDVANQPRYHPTQKPIAVMLPCLEVFPKAATILDPYAGSGSTLIAAKKLGRHFLGFEISPEYCEITRRRLAEIDAQPSLFEPKPVQLTLGGKE